VNFPVGLKRVRINEQYQIVNNRYGVAILMRLRVVAKISAAVAAVGLIALHFVGVLYDWEENHWSTVAKFSFDLVDHSTSTDIAAHAVINAFQSDDVDRVAAKAVCEYLKSTQQPTTYYQFLVMDIEAEVPPALNITAVQGEIRGLAGKIQGVTQGGAKGHLYREACYGIA
jgi:hypothetical protein